MPAFIFLLLFQFELQGLLFGPLFLEIVISAAIQRQFALIEMQDVVDRLVEQIAVMADHQRHMRIARQIFHQPQRAFEIEIVGRLVQQQEVGFGKQHGGQCHAHPPATRKGRAGPRLRFAIKAQTMQHRSRAGGRGMGLDINQTDLDFGNAGRIGGRFGFRQQSSALCGGCQHDFEQRFGARGGLLGDRADSHAAPDGDGAGFAR